MLAYIDPGVGLLIWQSIVAAFLGMLFYLRKTRQFIVRSVKRLFRAGGRDEQISTNLPPPAPDAGK